MEWRFNKTILYCGFLAGAKRIFDQQGYLNKINIFPVPDADTGTNMASTMQTIIEQAVPSTHLKDVLTSISDAALIGARGNSGIIFAQYLYGISNELPNKESLDTVTFAKSIRKAFDYAYDAVVTPVEGTIITMLREWSIKFEELAQTCSDFVALFKNSYEHAKQILYDISMLLEKLAKAKVVDAGAQSVVFFLEGVVSFLENQSVKEVVQARSQVQQLEANFQALNHEEITFRYCTECLIAGENMQKDKIRSAIEHLGDSVVIAGSKTKMRLHIHTDEPALVYERMITFGKIVFQKVDDMVFQKEISESRKSNIALVIDSCADIPKKFIEQHQIHVLPLNLMLEGNQFIDRVTISSDQFYEQLQKSKLLPTTSQPTQKDFINKFNYLKDKYEHILSISLSSKLSGTYANSASAALKVKQGEDVSLVTVDSKCASGTYGLMVQMVAKAIADGVSIENILQQIPVWQSKLHLLLAPKTLKFFIRGGRLSSAKGFFANIFNLKPIVSMNEIGEGITLTKHFGQKRCLDAIISCFEKAHRSKGIAAYCVLYANKEDLQKAEKLARRLEKVSGRQTAYIMQISPVLGSHGGNGCFEIAYITC